MTMENVRKASVFAREAAAALIPLAAGGRDSHGNIVVDAEDAILRARRALREALHELSEED